MPLIDFDEDFIHQRNSEIDQAISTREDENHSLKKLGSYTESFIDIFQPDLRDIVVDGFKNPSTVKQNMLLFFIFETVDQSIQFAIKNEIQKNSDIINSLENQREHFNSMVNDQSNEDLFDRITPNEERTKVPLRNEETNFHDLDRSNDGNVNDRDIDRDSERDRDWDPLA